MSFNKGKFQLLRIGHNNELKNSTNLFTGEMDSIIEQKDSVKDLGILVDENMKYKSQKNAAYIRARRKANWILRTFSSRDKHTMTTLWKSLVQPHLYYCSQVWAPVNQAGELQEQESILSVH